jgi:phospholipid/cholesterol/gamma-HCH transport system ATP-binding protein
MLKDGEVYKEGSLSEFENSTDSYVSSFFKTKKLQ